MVRTEKINTLGVARLKIACKWKREMVSFVLGKEREKDVFRLVTSVRQRKTETMLFSCTDSDVNEA